MTTPKLITIDNFLTMDQIDLAIRLKTKARIQEQIIEPHLDEINEKLGQENDPAFLAYACEYVVSQFLKEHAN